MSFIDNVRTSVSKIGKVVKDTYGPLAALEGPNNTATTYRYPLDVGNSQRYPHTVEFQTWKPTQVPITDLAVVQQAKSGVNGAFGAIGNFVEKGNKAVGAAAGAINQFIPGNRFDIKAPQLNLPQSPLKLAGLVDTPSEMKVNRNQKYNSRMLDWTRRAEKSDMIAMYMPAGGWMDRVTNAYQQQSMTAAMGRAGAILDVAGSVIKEADFGANDGGEGFWKKAMDALNGPAGIEAAATIAGGFGLDAGVLRDAGLNAIGYALNPQFEMLYSGTDLREFQFDFTMTPRSEEEALIIRRIIRKFKYHASPEYVTGQGRYIVPPSYFDITFKFNGEDSDWLPQISTCVLKQFDVDYTGGLEQWATHADGSPVQVKMTMIFAELEMMHKRLRRKGY